MTTSHAQKMAVLAEDIATSDPEAETELTAFPSGGAMLDVRRAGRLFVMAYSPSQGFGVDEVEADDGFGTGYRFTFEDFEPAATRLRQLVDAEAEMQESPDAPSRSRL